ncbi:MAG: diguanylate cyclase [Leptolinea sp.]|nr:diguanylate cyclase [Leptolinea sp.]
MIIWDFNPYALALLATGIFSLILSVLLFFRWNSRDCVLLAFALLFTAEWNFFVGFESAVQNTEIKILFAKFSYFGVFNCLPLFLLFVLNYFGLRRLITYPRVALLWVIPIIVIILVATNENHNLIWSGYVTPPDSIFSTLVYHCGPLYWLGVGYIYFLISVMGVLLFLKYKRTQISTFKKQALIILLGVFPPLLANILYVFRIPALKYLDATPIGFFLTGLLLFIGLTKFRLLEIAPVARGMLFDDLTDGLIVIDMNHYLADINQSAKKYLKYPGEEWSGIPLSEGLIDIPGLEEAINNDVDFLIESTPDPDVTLQVEGKNISQSKVDQSGWLLAIRNISERKIQEKAEVERREFAEALRDVSIAVNSTLDLDEVLNRILASLFNVLPCNMANIVLIEDGIGRVKCFHGYLSPKEVDWIKSASFNVQEVPNMKMMIETGKPMFITDTRLVDFFSNPNVLSYMGSPIKVKDEVIGFLNLDSNKPNTYSSMEECERLQTFADLAGIAIENARLYEKMKESAIIDELTGINNRRNLLTIAEKEFERALRYQTPLSIIMLDIDNFKDINDTHGHIAGDIVLSRVGKTLSDFIRVMDIAGRYGGDEFCIVLPETNLKDADSAAHRLLEEFHKIEVPSINSTNYLQASMGVSTKDETTTSLEELLIRADDAMYKAKKNGRNQVASA